jgi:hypothetical protein
MRKFFDSLFGLWLPIALIILSIVSVTGSYLNGSLIWIDITYGIANFILSALWIREWKKDTNREKIDSIDTSDIILPEIEDNGNLDEMHTQKDAALATSVNTLVDVCYKASYAGGWHTAVGTGQLLDRNRAEMLCLIHSEISEAMEGERKGLMDDHLPNRPMPEVELADAVIRIADYCGRWGYDLGGAIVEKLAYNAQRADHKQENRLKNGGKKF